VKKRLQNEKMGLKIFSSIQHRNTKKRRNMKEGVRDTKDRPFDSNINQNSQFQVEIAQRI